MTLRTYARYRYPFRLTFLAFVFALLGIWWLRHFFEGFAIVLLVIAAVMAVLIYRLPEEEEAPSGAARGRSGTTAADFLADDAETEERAAIAHTPAAPTAEPPGPFEAKYEKRFGNIDAKLAMRRDADGKYRAKLGGMTVRGVNQYRAAYTAWVDECVADFNQKAGEDVYFEMTIVNQMLVAKLDTKPFGQPGVHEVEWQRR